MAISAPTNTDLPSSWLLPGVFIKLNLSGSGAGLNSVTKRLLLLGYKTSSGSQGSDTPIQVTQQADANSYFGNGSDLARLYAAATSQIGGGVANIFCLPIDAPSGGTAATHLIALTGPATSAGALDVWICGYRVTVAIANGDSNSTIGTALTAAINLVTDLPVTASGTSTVTLTYKHKGVVGNDLPVIVNCSASGVTTSPGTITFATNATGSAAVSVTIGTTTISSTTTADTATNNATAFANTINSGSYPVTASASSGVITLLYATDRVVHRISTTTADSTMTSTAAVGTAGAGTPTLTTALSNAGGQTAYPVWCTSFNEATSLGTLSTHIELYANGVNQKGQRLFFGGTQTLATSGAVPAASTPALTASPRYMMPWCPDSPQQASELAARAAAEHIATDYAPRNYDGTQLKTRGNVPLMLPHKAVRPAPSDQNSALYSYYMTPLVVDEGTGTLQILRGRTTSAATDSRLWDWGTIATLDYYRYDLGAFLKSTFSAKNVKLTGTPKTTNTVNLQSIKDAVYERLKKYDDADLFDDIDSIKSSIVVSQDSLVPTRIDVGVPCRPPLSLHQLGVVGNLI